MQCHIEHAKDQLHQFYLDNYAKMPTPPPAIQPVVTETSGSQRKVNFTAWYKKCPSTLKDKFEEFYKLPQEDFDTCDPIQWWSGRRSQFPNLSRLAQDILAMPGEFTSTHLDLPTNYLAILLQGSAVAVERIFSGGQCKMVNWLFTLEFPVQTNTDGSFLVVFEVVYVVRWYKYR